MKQRFKTILFLFKYYKDKEVLLLASKPPVSTKDSFLDGIYWNEGFYISFGFKSCAVYLYGRPFRHLIHGIGYLMNTGDKSHGK